MGHVAKLWGEGGHGVCHSDFENFHSEWIFHVGIGCNSEKLDREGFLGKDHLQKNEGQEVPNV